MVSGEVSSAMPVLLLGLLTPNTFTLQLPNPALVATEERKAAGFVEKTILEDS